MHCIFLKFWYNYKEYDNLIDIDIIELENPGIRFIFRYFVSQNSFKKHS